jgi:hypothetical protein
MQPAAIGCIPHRMARPPTDLSSAYVAQRLRAHARLCLQVALESRSELAASDFARLADRCSRMANELEPVAGSAGSPRYH